MFLYVGAVVRALSKVLLQLATLSYSMASMPQEIDDFPRDEKGCGPQLCRTATFAAFSQASLNSSGVKRLFILVDGHASPSISYSSISL